MTDRNFITRHYKYECDLTEVLIQLIRQSGKMDEKELLHWLIMRLSSHQLKMTEVLSRAFSGMEKRISGFFQKRVESYRESMRIGKLFSFRSWSSIEREATEKAWQDTARMIDEISSLHDRSVKGLVNDHRTMLRMISRALIDIVREKADLRIDISRDDIERFLQ